MCPSLGFVYSSILLLFHKQGKYPDLQHISSRERVFSTEQDFDMSRVTTQKEAEDSYDPETMRDSFQRGVKTSVRP